MGGGPAARLSRTQTRPETPCNAGAGIQGCGSGNLSRSRGWVTNGGRLAVAKARHSLPNGKYRCSKNELGYWPPR